MRPRSLATTLALLLLLLLLPAPSRRLQGQVVDTLRLAPEGAEVLGRRPEAEERGGITPGGAFLRSLLVPGWGHARVGAPVRGGFYFALQSATGLMLFKTQGRLNRARNRVAMYEAALTARLTAQGVTDLTAVEKALEDDLVVADARALVEARGSQREDWTALGVFFLFLGGADAYVSAHLANFPTPVEIQGTPDGGVQIGVSIPVGRR